MLLLLLSGQACARERQTAGAVDATTVRSAAHLVQEELLQLVRGLVVLRRGLLNVWVVPRPASSRLSRLLLNVAEGGVSHWCRLLLLALMLLCLGRRIQQLLRVNELLLRLLAPGNRRCHRRCRSSERCFNDFVVRFFR